MYKLTPPNEHGDNNYHRRSVVIEKFFSVIHLRELYPFLVIEGLSEQKGEIRLEDIICIKVLSK